MINEEQIDLLERTISKTWYKRFSVIISKSKADGECSFTLYMAGTEKDMTARLLGDDTLEDLEQQYYERFLDEEYNRMKFKGKRDDFQTFHFDNFETAKAALGVIARHSEYYLE